MDCLAYAGFGGSPCFVQREEYQIVTQATIDWKTLSGTGLAVGDYSVVSMAALRRDFPVWDVASAPTSMCR